MHPSHYPCTYATLRISIQLSAVGLENPGFRTQSTRARCDYDSGSLVSQYASIAAVGPDTDHDILPGG